MNARITFVGNPWPKGHAAKLTLRVKPGDGEAYLDVGLESADYSAEGDAPEAEAESDWQSPIVWNNYHSAEFGGVLALPAGVARLADLAGVTVRADHDKVARTDWDWDDLAFDHCYILGHDAIAGHTLRFERAGSHLEVRWTGKVAQAYVGDYAFKHDFVVVGTVPLPQPT